MRPNLLAVASAALLFALHLPPAHGDDPPVEAEATESATEAAEQQPPSQATVLHVAPAAGTSNRELRLVAVVDAAWTEAELIAGYRQLGSSDSFVEVIFERSSAGGYYATIPATLVDRPGIEYYIAGRSPAGEEIFHFASAEAPQPVRVEPSSEVRWAQKEERRLGGLVSSIGLDLKGHNFDNRYGKDDYYFRGEIDWTHRLLLRYLYSISLGYGLIEGKTPAGDTAQSGILDKGARYGFGAILLRLHRSVWLETRATIGIDREEMVVGTAAKLTLGRPWRASVDLGAELFENLGPSLWVRLQWDTVPPFIMGASIVKTDLPAATLSGGSYIAYDISYPISSRVTLRGNLSFGSRDGSGNFGGGIGSAFWF